MIDQIINPSNWVIQPFQQQIVSNKKITTQHINSWYNPDSQISPLKLYKYLKARFGPPNGLIMALKNPSSDNLIHWHYSLQSYQGTIDFLGKTSGLEILIKSETDKLFQSDWERLVKILNAEFKNMGKEMSSVQNDFEHWKLFINPFCRIEQILQDCINKLERIKVKEVSTKKTSSEEEINKYQKELNKWVDDTFKIASLGTIIRMLTPVMAEAFINLIILVFRKDEYKSDERLYESLLRQQIDVRIKTLHLHCICFPSQIDCNTEAFKHFHTLMNKRNDFLHGNVDPYKLIVEDVWFDQKIIPLFERDEGIIKKMTRNYCTNVEPEKALSDFNTVSNLIELILMAMDRESLMFFVQLMSDRMPGINKKNNRLGILFPQHLVENFAYHNKLYHPLHSLQ